MLAEIKGLNEECGIFGIWGHKDAAHVAYYGLHSLQHRGQEGAGIVVKDGRKLTRHRGPGLVAEVFTKDILDGLKGTAAIGHVRYSTAGKNELENVQPLLFHFENDSLALCHNGHLVNAKILRRELEEQGSIFQTSSDSEVMAHLIKRNPRPNIVETLKRAFNKIRGGFTYILFTQNEMIAARDINGIRPLSIGSMGGGGGFVIASETCAFDTIGASHVRDVRPGEMIVINDRGMRSELFAPEGELAICSMEYIYLARPDSDIAGINVHTARKNMGKILAKEAPVQADVVTAVPDSGVSAAIGFSETTGIPYEMGLIKSRYVARTFIQPSQELREQGVKMKLSAVRGVVAGKSVVVIDDSIVRGTTTRRLVQLLREAGAAAVHVRISSPQLKYPCFYGIDIQSTGELIGFDHTVDEIRAIIGANSLAFLSEDGLINAVNIQAENKYKGLCMAYFNGDYPTPLYDYEEEVRDMLGSRYDKE
ncbi:MAG: amidophosphoribosyltransferase [Treponema sp.]|nr:amidophosphoribosyltransferase [Treponema sp.]